MLQVLGTPFPELSVLTSPYRFAIRVAQTLALLVFWQYASRDAHRSFFVQWGLLFLIFSMLPENLFRAPFMAGYCTHAWVFAFVSNIPKLLGIAIVCALVVAASPYLRRAWQQLVAATILAAFAMFALSPLLGMAFAPVMKAIAGLAPQSEWCTLPYGLNVLIPAYLSFAEPTLACVAAALSGVEQTFRVADIAVCGLQRADPGDQGSTPDALPLRRAGQRLRSCWAWRARASSRWKRWRLPSDRRHGGMVCPSLQAYVELS